MNTDKEIQKMFRFRGRNDNLPWCSPTGTRGTLADLLGQLDFRNGVEVGVRKGDYSKTLCEKIPKINLFCVDPWCHLSNRVNQEVQDRFFAEAQDKLSQYNVRFVKKFSMDAVGIFEDDSLDFVYIDGNHEFDYVVQDIIHWSKKVKKGGIVALHDYYNFYNAGVVKAVDAYTHCHRINPWYVTKERMPTAFWVKK